MADLELKVIKDTATPALKKLVEYLSPASIKRAVGAAVVRLVQGHLRGNPPNAQGFPSTGFWGKAAAGTSWDPTDEGVVIHIDNDEAPGAVRHLFNGGVVQMKDKMLTIPASAPFYGHRATEFTNLRLAVFGKGGPAALVVGGGGAGTVNFSTGRERGVRGAGARSEGMVAYWLKEEVTHEPHPEILPEGSAMAEVAKQAIVDLVNGRGNV